MSTIKFSLDQNLFGPYTVLHMTKTKHKKEPSVLVKQDYMELRLDVAEKDAFRQAAQMAGMSLSGWVRDRLRRNARKELEDMDMPVAFLERLSV